MVQSSLTYDQIIERFQIWGQSQSDIRAAIVIGSRARTDRPADQWSDLDILVITTQIHRYIEGETWLGQFGAVWFSFLESQAVGNGIERRVLFECGLDVDFALLPADGLQVMIAHGLPPDVVGIFWRGYRFILDKDGLSQQFDVASSVGAVSRPPGEAEFQNVCKDYWYHTIWAMKKLLRGEVWAAHRCANCYMGERLAQMLTWHAQAVHGETFDTWHSGRFLDRWADPQAVTDLRQVFAHYEPTDIRRALLAQMNLFRRLAQETADRLHYAYPGDADRHATSWVTALSV